MLALIGAILVLTAGAQAENKEKLKPPHPRATDARSLGIKLPI